MKSLIPMFSFSVLFFVSIDTQAASTPNTCSSLFSPRQAGTVELSLSKELASRIYRQMDIDSLQNGFIVETWLSSRDLGEVWNSILLNAKVSPTQVWMTIGQIRSFALSYAQKRKSIQKSIDKTLPSEVARNEFKNLLDRRAYELVSKGLKQLRSEQPPSAANGTERDTVELRAKLGTESWEFKTSELAPILKNNPKEAALLTLGEALALAIYTGGEYEVINPALRDTVSEENWEWVDLKERRRIRIEAVRPEIELALSALRKFPDFKGRVTRVVVLEGAYLASYQVGAVIRELGFTSTSKGENAPDTFSGNAFLEIESKTGKDIGFINPAAEENEVLFPPGAQFKILEKRSEHGMLYIKMTEI